MDKLAIFIFNQQWYHLGSLLEAVMKHHCDFISIDVYIFDSMPLLPLHLHSRFPGQNIFKIKNPEDKITSYLKDQLGDKIQIHRVKLSKSSINEVKRTQQILQNFEQETNLDSFVIENMAVGMAIKSHLISKSMDSQPDLRKYRSTVLSAIKTFLRMNDWFRNQDSIKSVPEVWICNGRPFHERLAREMCQNSGKRVKYYEVGGEGLVPKRWILHETSPHDRVLHQNEIEQHWSAHGFSNERIELWVASRTDKETNPFYRNGNSKSPLQMRKPYIVFFSSSEDEVAAISNSWKSAWGDQINAVKRLMKEFEKQNVYNLIIRVHPNQANKSKSDQRRWKLLEGGSNSLIISQDEEVDSYELIARAEGVLVYQSTIGVESAYMKKPLAFLAPTRYDMLIPSRRLDTCHQISTWLLNLPSYDHELIEKSYLGARKWINYMVSAGNDWNHLEINEENGRITGFIRGESLRAKNTIVILTRIYQKFKEFLEFLLSQTFRLYR